MNKDLAFLAGFASFRFRSRPATDSGPRNVLETAKGPQEFPIDASGPIRQDASMAQSEKHSIQFVTGDPL